MEPLRTWPVVALRYLIVTDELVEQRVDYRLLNSGEVTFRPNVPKRLPCASSRDVDKLEHYCCFQSVDDILKKYPPRALGPSG